VLGSSAKSRQLHWRGRYSRRWLARFDLKGVSSHVLTLLLLLPAFVAPVAGYIDSDLVVETNRGKIRGVTLKSATNK